MNVYLVIFLVALVTITLRYIPFLIFKDGKVSKEISKLGEDLPMAIMILLVIYCIKDVNIIKFYQGFADIIAILVVIIIHYYKKNILFTILVGTVVYMVLIQYIFI